MATLDDIGSALQKADAAGDTEGAKRLAQAYREMQSEPPKSTIISKLGTSEPQQDNRSWWEKAKDAVIVPPEKREQMRPGMAGVSDAFADIPAEMGKQSSAALGQLGHDIMRGPEELAKDPLSMTMFGGAPRVGLDALAVLGSPITGALSSILGRPIEKATGLRREITGNVASAFLPVGPKGASLARAGETAIPATEAQRTSEAYQASVKALQDRGIKLTPGQMRGGQVRRLEEAHKSDPLVGEAIRNAENEAITGFNKAMYNEVLKPIGEKFTGEEAGTKGVKEVGDRLSRAYDEIKPRLSLNPDDELLSDLSEIRSRSSELPPAQEKQLEAILNNRVLHRLREGAMDGEAFKQVESELTTLARSYKSSSDAAQRELGGHLEEVTGALRDNLERTASPEVRERLKDINTGWAMLTRLEGAAGRRATSGGVFTTGDLLGSIKTADKSVRKRTFARGDALLQDFANQANDVLPNRLPDSGTAERANVTRPHGLTMYLLGRLTNKGAAMGMNRLRDFAPPGPSAPRAGLPPEAVRSLPTVNALRALTDQSQNPSGGPLLLNAPQQAQQQ